jgi:hypothetical protein
VRLPTVVHTWHTCCVSCPQIERFKAAAKQEREAREEAVRQLRKVERQKMDLLSAFKKQLRLINILKRQKVHVRVGSCLVWRGRSGVTCASSSSADRGCEAARLHRGRVYQDCGYGVVRLKM